MKRNIALTLLTACVTAFTAFTACDPVEPATHSENFFRIATVKFDGNDVTFFSDYEHTTYYTSNVRDTATAISFGLKDGMRIKAWFTLDAVGTMDNHTITLNGFAKHESTRCVGSKPSDTLNYYYLFDQYDINREILGRNAQVSPTLYPSVWNEGHIVNVTPTYFVPNDNDTAAFYLYPIELRADTLVLRLYSYIPDCDVSINPDYTQKLLSLDISSIRDRADNPAEQELRDTILARLDRLNKDKIVVTVQTPLTARAKDSKNPAGDYTRPIPGLPTDPITIPFDF